LPSEGVECQPLNPGVHQRRVGEGATTVLCKQQVWYRHQTPKASEDVSFPLPAGATVGKDADQQRPASVVGKDAENGIGQTSLHLLDANRALEERRQQCAQAIDRDLDEWETPTAIVQLRQEALPQESASTLRRPCESRSTLASKLVQA
jgi:hypothetical protein